MIPSSLSSTLKQQRLKASRGRSLSTVSSTARLPVSRRAMLYVPGSNPRMLEKSLSSPADSVAYDLEDSVSPGKKADARRLISDLLNGERRPRGEVVARVNAIGTGYEEEDLDAVASHIPLLVDYTTSQLTTSIQLRTRHVEAIALPKTDCPEHIKYVISRINALSPPHKRSGQPDAIKIIAMIEDARAMVAIEAIAASGKGHLDALLFAAEDYCADVGLTRTRTRQELLYPRSKLVTTAKAFGLQAIDLVCVNYKDKSVLAEESEEGKRLGFDGKQAIHPEQIDIIHSSFAPSEQAILKAARVKFSFEHHDQLGKGAYSLDGVMIDAPVYKQAIKVLVKAEIAGLSIPNVTVHDI